MLASLLRPCLSALLLSTVFALSGGAQQPAAQPAPAQQPASHPAAQTQDAGQDSGVEPVPDETPQQRVERAWKIILTSLHDNKNGDRQEQAMNALSEMPRNARALDLIATSMTNPKLDVRTAAILAAGKTKSPALVEPLHKMLDDPEPQVVFAAAATLWKEFHDTSSADILQAVMEGDRKTGPSLMRGAQHDMSHTMHSPSSLARIGIDTGAGFLLGPFGYAVTGAEYVHGKSGTGARVQAINMLAEHPSPDFANDLVNTLGDKDEAVRAAVVHQLGQFRSPQYAPDIAPLLGDAHLPVRLSAAAAYINSMDGAKP